MFMFKLVLPSRPDFMKACCEACILLLGIMYYDKIYNKINKTYQKVTDLIVNKTLL